MPTIGNWLYRRAQASGKKTAIVYNDRKFSYEEMNCRVNRLANGLLKLGVRKGDRVAAMLMNCNEIVEALFACAKVGAIFLPINCRLSAAEIDFILKDGAIPKVLIYCKRFSDVMDSLVSDVPIENLIQVGGQAKCVDYESFLAGNPEAEPGCDVAEEDVHLIIYTSGTTGFPKGAMLTQANTYWSTVEALKAEPLFETDITLTVAPLFHVAAIVVLTLPLIFIGGTVIIKEKFDPQEIMEAIEREKVTCAFMVPCMWRGVMKLLNSEQHELGSMRFGVVAGAPCPSDVISFFNGKGVPLTQVLGMTEAPLISLLKICDAERKIGSVGPPVLESRVLGSNDLEVPQGEIGELVIRGPGVIKGYWMRPEGTRQALIDDWFRTGDLVREDADGYLYVVGRKKDMIISGGENVYPAEVEQVIYQHPEIKEVAIIGVPDEKWGESVKAVAVLNDTSGFLTIEDVRSFCEGKLARYKIPKALEVVAALPRNPMGKLLKDVLKKNFC